MCSIPANSERQLERAVRASFVRRPKEATAVLAAEAWVWYPTLHAQLIFFPCDFVLFSGQ
jgi:hypothetical protein